ncbi:MAG: glutathione S-transferase [Geminicoccaceae bacterium]
MKLISSGASPFARKVLVVVHELGLTEKVEVLSRATSPVDSNADVIGLNPTGRIPALLLDDGTALYDSRVICEYLDSLGGASRLFPKDGPERWTALRQQALGDGMLDSAVNTRYETFLRPEPLRWQDWVAGQKLKVTRALDRLEAEDVGGFGLRVDIGTIAIACTLGYIDFRFADDHWRRGRRRLAAWYETFAARPAMAATRPA